MRNETIPPHPFQNLGAAAMFSRLCRFATPSARVGLLGFLALAGFALFMAGKSGERPIQAEPRAPQDQDPVPQAPTSGQKPATNIVRQGFPAAKANPKDLAKSDTAWEVEWELTHPENMPFYPPGSM